MQTPSPDAAVVFSADLALVPVRLGHAFASRASDLLPSLPGGALLNAAISPSRPRRLRPWGRTLLWTLQEATKTGHWSEQRQFDQTSCEYLLGANSSIYPCPCLYQRQLLSLPVIWPPISRWKKFTLLFVHRLTVAGQEARTPDVAEGAMFRLTRKHDYAFCN